MQKSPGAASPGLRSYILFDYIPLIKCHYSIPHTIIFIAQSGFKIDICP